MIADAGPRKGEFMFELRRISPADIPEALEKALRYRLLNEPLEAESICLDILAVEPNHQQALVTLLLALTDQFTNDFATARERALEVIGQLETDYARVYFEGIIHERWAKAQSARGIPVDAAAGWLRRAMRCYELADELGPEEGPDAALRWNTCARMLLTLSPRESTEETGQHQEAELGFGDDVPPR